VSPSLDAVLWPHERCSDAVERLGRGLGVATRREGSPRPPDHLQGAAFVDWVEECASWHGVEVRAIQTTSADLRVALSNLAPAIVPIPCASGSPGLLLLHRGGRRTVRVLSPNMKFVRVSTWKVMQALQAAGIGDPSNDPRPWFEAVSLHSSEAAMRAWQEMRMRDRPIGPLFALRPAARAPLRYHLRWHRLIRFAIGGAAAHALQYAFWILSWALLGAAVFGGRLDPGWLSAWFLVLLTLAPLRAFVTYRVGVVTTRFGALLAARVLAAAQRLDTDAMRGEGIGRQLGRVFETEQVADLGMRGAFPTVFASLEIIIAAPLLVMGVGGFLELGVLAICVAILVVRIRRYAAARRAWAVCRLTMTRDMVESMIGHATRRVQETLEHWHDLEDAGLQRYHEISRRLDDQRVLLSTIPRIWMVLGVAAILPSALSDDLETGRLALALGGVLLVQQSFDRLARGAVDLAGAIIAWDNVAQLELALQVPARVASPSIAMLGPELERRGSRLEVVDLWYQHTRRPEPSLQACGFELPPRARALLEGCSGSGKSTLTAILAGLRESNGGTVLIDGLDRGSLGEHGWRKRVACAPQSHENHMFGGSLGANLLLSRHWPPEPDAIREAEVLVRELGLGSLLDRMPDGIQQLVGETGWQLSQGECARIYVARALLQRASFVILDESLAALDPVTLERTVKVLHERAPTLLVIAHP